MSEIKRYQFKEGLSAYRESPNGEWVRWEDVEKLLKPRRMTFEEIAEAIKLASEPTLARLGSMDDDDDEIAEIYKAKREAK
jgi:hypothetical protein